MYSFWNLKIYRHVLRERERWLHGCKRVLLAWASLEKSQLGALCPIPAKLPDHGFNLLLLLAYQPFLPHFLSSGFGPRCLGKKQFFEVTMWPANPAGFPPCDLALLSKFHPLHLQIISQCFPFSRLLFSQDIPPFSSLGQLLLFLQESE